MIPCDTTHTPPNRGRSVEVPVDTFCSVRYDRSLTEWDTDTKRSKEGVSGHAYRSQACLVGVGVARSCTRLLWVNVSLIHVSCPVRQKEEACTSTDPGHRVSRLDLVSRQKGVSELSWDSPC